MDMRRYAVQLKNVVLGRPCSGSYRLKLITFMQLYSSTQPISITSARRRPRKKDAKVYRRLPRAERFQTLHQSDLPQPHQRAHCHLPDTSTTEIRRIDDLPVEIIERLVVVSQRLYADETAHSGAELSFLLAEHHAEKVDSGKIPQLTRVKTALSPLPDASADICRGEASRSLPQAAAVEASIGSRELPSRKDTREKCQAIEGVGVLTSQCVFDDSGGRSGMDGITARPSKTTLDTRCTDLKKVALAPAAVVSQNSMEGTSSEGTSSEGPSCTIRGVDGLSCDIHELLTLGNPEFSHSPQQCRQRQPARLQTHPALQAATELLLPGLDVKALLRGGALADVYIAHKCLSQADFSFIPWRNTHVEDCDLSLALFYGAVFLEQVTFRRCNFESSLLNGVVIQGDVKFIDCSFRFASLGLVRKICADKDPRNANRRESGSVYQGTNKRAHLGFYRCDFDLANFERSKGLNDPYMFVDCLNEQNAYKYPLCGALHQRS